MAWRDQLRPASFRGVPFEVVTGTVTAGRRLARHEYPQRDVPYMEDMGRRARDYKVEGYIIGPDYMAGRDRLLAAIEMAGAGQLMHPYYGNRLVAVGECELVESTEQGGMVRFTLPCTEAGEQIQPTSGVDSRVRLVQAQDAAFTSVATDFSSAFSVAGLPGWGVSTISSTFTDLLRLSDFRQLVSGVRKFTSGIADLLGLPDALAAELIGLVRSLTSVADLSDAPYKPFSGSLSLTQGQAKRSVVSNQQAIATALVKRAALIQYAGIATDAELATSDDVQAARASLLAAFDAHDYAADAPRPSTTVAAQLREVRSAALVHLSRQNAALPQTYALSLPEPQPALALSYALYGDLRGADIVQRNAVRHPGFVPAGVPLQLTTT